MTSATEPFLILRRAFIAFLVLVLSLWLICFLRFFCNVCGSKLFLEVLGDPDQIYVAMGLFDTKPQNLPEPYHIYVGSKAFWHTITGTQVQYETAP